MRRTASLGLALAISGTAAPAATAHGPGGATAPGAPSVEALICADGRERVCPRGRVLTISGRGLEDVRRVVFPTRGGHHRKRSTRPRARANRRLSVTVPKTARSGRLRLIAAGGTAHTPRLRVTRPRAADTGNDNAIVVDGPRPARFTYPATPGAVAVRLVRLPDGTPVGSWPAASTGGTMEFDGRIDGREQPPGEYAVQLVQADGAPIPGAPNLTFTLLDHIFPIRGRHDLGQSKTNNFGGGRGHKGQDMFAKCGTPLVAAQGGTVLKAARERRAGNYVVIQLASGESEVYMHMRRRPLVRTGERVETGQPIGEVGETGAAQGCHLHFELWTEPGWYRGGRPINPLPKLRQWDAAG